MDNLGHIFGWPLNSNRTWVNSTGHYFSPPGQTNGYGVVGKTGPVPASVRMVVRRVRVSKD